MITSWENECKVRAEPSLLGFCRTVAAFMKLLWRLAHRGTPAKQRAETIGASREQKPNSFGL